MPTHRPAHTATQHVTKCSESAFNGQRRQIFVHIYWFSLHRDETGIFLMYDGGGFVLHRLKIFNHQDNAPSFLFLLPGQTVTVSAGRSGNDSEERYFWPDCTVSLRQTSGSCRRVLILSWNFSLYWLKCMMLSGSSANQNLSNSYAR